MSKSMNKTVKEVLGKAFEETELQIIFQLMARLPHYSFRNILLLRQQCPQASKLRKFHSWRKYGRHVREGEKAIKICFYMGKKKEAENSSKEQDENDYRYSYLFDISQTASFVNVDNTPPNNPVILSSVAELANHTKPESENVKGFPIVMSILQSVAPFPIQFRADAAPDGACKNTTIYIRAGTSQLHAICATLRQISYTLNYTYHGDLRYIKAIADCVAYIVCCRMGLHPGLIDLSKAMTVGNRLDNEDRGIFLNSVQSSAMFIIDTVDGEMEARKIGFDTSTYMLIIARKTVARLFEERIQIQLVNPDLTMLPAKNLKSIEEHEGPFAISRTARYGSLQIAA